MDELVEPTKQVACGISHSVALTGKGEVLNWGSSISLAENPQDNLGKNNNSNYSMVMPKAVSNLSKIENISCGTECTVCVNDQVSFKYLIRRPLLEYILIPMIFPGRGFFLGRFWIL
jgi:hypothetical protein